MGASLFSFFSGVGMLDLAFEKNEFEVVLVNEYDRQFLNAYQYARRELNIQPPKYGYYQKSAEYFSKNRGAVYQSGCCDPDIFIMHS